MNWKLASDTWSLFLILLTLILVWHPLQIDTLTSYLGSYPTTKGEGFIYSYQTLIAGILALLGGKAIFKVTIIRMKAAIKTQWVQDFRDHVAEFITAEARLNQLKTEWDHILNILSDIRKRQNQFIDFSDEKARDAELKDEYNFKKKKCAGEIEELQNKTHLILLQIQLFLDLNKPSHIKFDKLLGKLSNTSSEIEKLKQHRLKENHESKMEQLYNEHWNIKKDIVLTTKEILKEELITL